MKGCWSMMLIKLLLMSIHHFSIFKSSIPLTLEIFWFLMIYRVIIVSFGYHGFK